MPEEIPPLLPPEPPPMPPKPILPTKSAPLGIGKTMLLCLIFYGCAIAPEVALGLLKYGAGVSISASAGLLLQQLFAWPVTLWLAWVLAPRPWAELLAIKPFLAVLMPPLIISGMGLTILVTEVSAWIPMPEFVKEIFKNLMSGHVVWIVLAICVIAPVAEELFFRGIILRNFLERYSTRKAVFWSALLFAVFHLNPWQAVVAFPLGVLAAWLVIRTGSVIPGIIVHAVINSSTNFLMEPLGALFGYSALELEEAAHVPWQMLVIGGVLTAAGLVWLWYALRVRELGK
jgi:uncharacterized protein